MTHSSFSSVGGILSAIIASLCCIGPVVAAFVGIGSIGAFAMFDEFRPYLIGVTGLLLGMAFYLTYRKREILCEDGTCKVESADRWNKLSVWGATVVAALALAFPYLGVALPSSTPSPISVDTTAVVTLTVGGMDCQACAFGLEGSLSSLKGVVKASIQFEDSSATIEYDPRVLAPQAIVERVVDNGLNATVTDASKNQSSSGHMVAVLSVGGMDCKACAAGLEGSLAGMEGIQSAQIDFEDSSATVEYDGEKQNVNSIADRIRKNGFTPVLLENRKAQ